MNEQYCPVFVSDLYDHGHKFVSFQSARGSIGGLIYRYMSTEDQFSPHYLLDQIDIASEHDALEIADHLEASMYIWRRKTSLHASKSSWDMVKDLIGEENKNEMLANRAESLLFCLKQRYRGLSQTTLDTSKIHYNKVRGSKNTLANRYVIHEHKLSTSC